MLKKLKYIKINSINLSYLNLRFGLENGNVGVYQKKNRLWRVKSKIKPISLIYIDPKKDGFNALLIGWETGKLEV